MKIKWHGKVNGNHYFETESGIVQITGYMEGKSKEEIYNCISKGSNINTILSEVTEETVKSLSNSIHKLLND